MCTFVAKDAHKRLAVQHSSRDLRKKKTIGFLCQDFVRIVGRRRSFPEITFTVDSNDGCVIRTCDPYHAPCVDGD